MAFMNFYLLTKHDHIISQSESRIDLITGSFEISVSDSGVISIDGKDAMQYTMKENDPVNGWAKNDAIKDFAGNYAYMHLPSEFRIYRCNDMWHKNAKRGFIS